MMKKILLMRHSIPEKCDLPTALIPLSEEGKALLKKWGVEGEWIGIGNCILGYPDEDPAMKPRKENFVYYVL